MIKYLTFTIFLLSSLFLEAQSNSNIGIKGGVNFTFFNVDQSNFGFNQDNATGFYGGVFLDIEVDKAFSDIEAATEQVKLQMEIVSSVSTQQAVATNEISEHIARVVLGAQANAEVAVQSESVANHLRKLTQAH